MRGICRIGRKVPGPAALLFAADARRPRESVDDLLQDVWLDVYRSLPKLSDPAAFPAWAYRIAL